MHFDVVVIICCLLLFIATSAIFQISIFPTLVPASDRLHQICINFIPNATSFPHELKAIVCAENFKLARDNSIYTASGLIHLFVISGAHLLLIESALLKVKYFHKKNVYVFLILGIYALMCSLNPPICRSLFGVFLSYLFLSINVKWPAHFRVLIAGLLSLAFNYKWLLSISLQMSWLAGLAAAVFTPRLSKTAYFQKQFLFFAFLLPTIAFFQQVSLFTILINLLLAPILEFVLFPLGIFVTVIHPAVIVFDFLLKLFRWILHASEMDLIPSNYLFTPALIYGNWVLIFALHGIAFSIHFIHARKNCIH